MARLGIAVECLEFRDAASLEPWTGPPPARTRLLAAVHLGPTRLIDNVAVELG